MPFFFCLALLLMNAAAAEEGSCGPGCCPWKKVGGEDYTLVYESDAAPSQGCQDNCVYTRDGGNGNHFCFEPGTLPVQCIKCKKLPGSFIEKHTAFLTINKNRSS